MRLAVIATPYETIHLKPLLQQDKLESCVNLISIS